MDGSRKPKSTYERFPQSFELILKKFCLKHCSIDERYIVPLSADNIVVRSHEKLLFLNLKTGEEISRTIKLEDYFKPIDRLAYGIYISCWSYSFDDGCSYELDNSSGLVGTLRNFSCEKRITAFSAAAPHKFVYSINDEYWRSAFLSGCLVIAEKKAKTAFKRVNTIAASGLLTAVSSKGSSMVEFWRNTSLQLRAKYEEEKVCELYRSKCWIFVKRSSSVIFYSTPNLDMTRVIYLNEFITRSNTERWTINIAPDESFAIIHYKKKMLLFHILSGSLIGQQALPKKAKDICLLPSGDLLVALRSSICIVHPSQLCLVDRLHKLGRKNIWGSGGENQGAMVQILTNAESAFAYCTSRDSSFCLRPTVDEFVASFHVLVLAFEELEDGNEEHRFVTLYSSKVAVELQKAHVMLRRRSHRHHKLVDQYMESLRKYLVISLEDMSKKVIYDYEEDEDVCILQNRDIFRLYEKSKNKEEFVTIFRQKYMLYYETEKTRSLSAAALEIISFTQNYLISMKAGSSKETSYASVQEFSNYLLGLPIPESQLDTSSLTTRLFKSTAAAIHSLAEEPLPKSYMNIWKEALLEFDLSTASLKKLFESIC